MRELLREPLDQINEAHVKAALAAVGDEVALRAAPRDADTPTYDAIPTDYRLSLKVDR